MGRLLGCGLVAAVIAAGCGDGGGDLASTDDDQLTDTTTGTQSDSATTTHNGGTDSGTDSESSTVDAALLADALDGLPTFSLGLPASLSGAVPSNAIVPRIVMTPDDVEDVRSEAFYQIQEERVFTVEIYQIRGLLALMEKIAAEESPPAEQVIELGVRTDLVYAGGPADGEPINPHLADLEPYEGVDCGTFKWWLEGDTLRVYWHITDPYFTVYPYWVIEVSPSEEDELMRQYAIAGLRSVWDGVQTSYDTLLLLSDEATGHTTIYSRNTIWIPGVDPAVSYQVISRRPRLAEEGIPIPEAVELYKENGEVLISEPEPWQPRASLLAIGDENGGGVASVTVPFSMWTDEGIPVDVQHLYVETYDEIGVLLRRTFARNFDGVAELSAFSWFQPATESLNFYEASPGTAPQEVFLRQALDIVGSGGTTLGSSLDGEAWDDVAPEDFSKRPVWKQVEGGAETWSPGDVLYGMENDSYTDCSVPGETICVLWRYLPLHVFPQPVQWFDSSFYGEEQWPVTRVIVSEGDKLKIEPSEIPPYAGCWLESDNNDVWDQGEAKVPCAGYSAYYYTPQGELVDALLPMIYGFTQQLPSGLEFDEQAAVLHESLVSQLRTLEEEWVPSLSADPGFVPPTEEELQQALDAGDETTDSDTQ